jgi:hypothetical protein
VIHDRLDLARWVAEYPLAGLDPDADLTGSGLAASPMTVAYVHQIREQGNAAGIDFGRSVPTDVCLWNWGDSPRREATKIGGIPYWPAAEQWPTAAGEPFTFVAQFCFADSTDILPALPGDILSVLVEGAGWGSWALRWFRLGEQQLAPHRLPPPFFRIAPCYATLHRTVDYIDPWGDYGSAAWEWLDRFKYPLGNEAGAFRHLSKIGGRWWPHGEYTHPDDVDDPEFKAELRRELDAVERQKEQFLCQLLSVSKTDRQPFVNVARYDDLPEADVGHTLMIADLGGLDLFFDGQTAFADCHCG